MYEYINSWRDCKESFEKQLQCNLFELNGNYPPHWNSFLFCIDKNKPKRVVDIGCGVGAYGKLCLDKSIEYIGYDYSENAIGIAKREWELDVCCSDYKDISKDHIKDGDLVVANALCDVLPNAHDCLLHLLNLDAGRILIQRIEYSSGEKYFSEYNAYNLTTYKFFHNREETYHAISSFGYSLKERLISDRSYDLEIYK
jgi:predicted TPR repeat methyltransferase